MAWLAPIFLTVKSCATHGQRAFLEHPLSVPSHGLLALGDLEKLCAPVTKTREENGDEPLRRR